MRPGLARRPSLCSDFSPGACAARAQALSRCSSPAAGLPSIPRARPPRLLRAPFVAAACGSAPLLPNPTLKHCLLSRLTTFQFHPPHLRAALRNCLQVRTFLTGAQRQQASGRVKCACNAPAYLFSWPRRFTRSSMLELLSSSWQSHDISHTGWLYWRNSWRLSLPWNAPQGVSAWSKVNPSLVAAEGGQAPAHATHVWCYIPYTPFIMANIPMAAGWAHPVSCRTAGSPG